jgi:hypothetical protein
VHPIYNDKKMEQKIMEDCKNVKEGVDEVET